MCDSCGSESCPFECVKAGSYDSEGGLKELSQKSRMKSKWWSRKTKATASHEGKYTVTSALEGCNTKDRCEGHSYSPVANIDGYYDSSSDEECNPIQDNSWLQEKPNCYVSQEELDALKGCVTRRRAVFSPSPSSSPVHSYVHQRRTSQLTPSHTNSLPVRRKGAVVTKKINHVHQGSFEYDHLKDYDPSMSVGNIPDSVSVQFRLQSNDDGNQCNNGIHQQNTKNYGFDTDISLSYSIPERLNSAVYYSGRHSDSRSVDNSQCISQCSHSCAFHSLQRNECNHSDMYHNWPQQKEPVSSIRNIRRALSAQVNVNSYSPPSGRSNPVLQHYRNSPFLGKFSSSLLSKQQQTPSDGNFHCTRTKESGSNNSLYSQTTSLTERPHRSYSKGVDGNVFKDQTEQLLSWFSEFNDQQRNMMLMKLLEHCDCAQMHFLSVQMEPILHERCPHNCQDLLSWLPFNIVTHIFSFLDPVSLCQASAVNKDWYDAASQQKLWERFCKLEKWKLSVSGELKYQAMFMNPDGSSRWKDMFAEKFRVRRNWLKGYCNVRTFEGHTQGISCIQFDETRIVSGSWDKTIKVWNRRTNTVWAALTLAGHSGTVRCLHLHNNRLVSGSSDRTIKVWDLATDKVGWVGAACRATMVGHMHTVRCLQADDERVISGSYDQTLKIWDIKTGQCLQTLRGHTDAVLCLKFDNHKVISGSKDKTIKIWSLPDGSCKLTFHGHEAAVSCLHFDEARIISGALDRSIKIWNMTTGECIRTIDWIRSEGHTGVVRHLQADSWKIISAADDKTLKVWNVDTGNRLLTLKSHTDGVTCLQFNDEIIVSGSYDKTVKLWDFTAC